MEKLSTRSYIVAAVAAASIAVSVAAGAPAMASSKAHNSTSAATCTVSADVVSAAGLPTDQVINFMVSDASGTSGWVLGYTSDGTWTVSVPPASGPTTYQFVSKTWGTGGSKYNVFASCTN